MPFCRDFFPFLGWMSNLESLIISRCHSPFGHDDYVTKILNWMFERKADTLRHIWVLANSTSLLALPFREQLSAPSVTSFYLGNESVWEPMYRIDLNDQRYCRIRHLGGLILTRSLEELPDLKYASFSCKDFKVNV